jgi:hypothetical protein
MVWYPAWIGEYVDELELKEAFHLVFPLEDKSGRNQNKVGERRVYLVGAHVRMLALAKR